MTTRTFKDQMGRTVSAPFPPKRIISLVPSQTELLFDLGLEEEVVGITKFCIHPEEQFRKKLRVGGTKQVHFDRIKALKPDLIIGNKEENTQEMIRALEQDYPVWLSDVSDLDDALAMIVEIGRLVDRMEKAQHLKKDIKDRFRQLPPPTSSPPTCVYFIWRKPYMVAANGTFIHAMLEKAGFVNALAHLDRYPEVSGADLRNLQPDYLLLSSEPYPFQQKHIDELQKICPKAVIRLVDGELFSWYGSRLLKAPGYFGSLRQELLGH